MAEVDRVWERIGHVPVGGTGTRNGHVTVRQLRGRERHGAWIARQTCDRDRREPGHWQAIALELAREGADVAIVARSRGT